MERFLDVVEADLLADELSRDTPIMTRAPRLAIRLNSLSSRTLCSRLLPNQNDEPLRIMAVLEGQYRDLCDIEFTIERGRPGARGDRPIGTGGHAASRRPRGGLPRR